MDMNESASICKENRLSMILRPIYCENIYIEAYDSMPICHDSTLYLVALKKRNEKSNPLYPIPFEPQSHEKYAR